MMAKKKNSLSLSKTKTSTKPKSTSSNKSTKLIGNTIYLDEIESPNNDKKIKMNEIKNIKLEKKTIQISSKISITMYWTTIPKEKDHTKFYELCMEKIKLEEGGGLGGFFIALMKKTPLNNGQTFYSHAYVKDKIFIAKSQGKQFSIDVEATENNNEVDWKKIANRFYLKDEKVKAKDYASFLETWTKKEATYKLIDNKKYKTNFFAIDTTSNKYKYITTKNIVPSYIITFSSYSENYN